VLLLSCCWRIGEELIAWGAIGGNFADSVSRWDPGDGGEEATVRIYGQRL
jgi:hypothetical protein